MDQFFQTIRKIQKKERNNSSLARVEDNFYKDIHKYLDSLRKSAGNDPFSDEYYLLKDTQRIATEICERREHKITDAAVVNIHRSYHIFTGKPEFDLVDTTPLNLTKEEEKFYFSLIDALKNHRGNISLDKLAKEEVEKSIKIVEKPPLKTGVSKESDAVLDKLKQINNAKIITDEKVEPIEKQVNKPNKVETSLQKENIPKHKINVNNSSGNQHENDTISSIHNQIDNQFVDFESKNLKKFELVLIFDNINQIMGVDERVYGPFRSQDLVVMPRTNAKIFAKNRKGRIIKF